MTENGVLRPHNGPKCYRVLEGTHSKHECDTQCRTLGGGAVCIGSMEENDGVFNGANIHPRCCSGTDVSCCTWIGLEQSTTNVGSKYHWDQWALTSDNTRCHSAFRNWAYGEPDDKDGADENCAIMGYHGRSNWLDVECEVTRAACLCEVNAAYGDTSGADGGDGDEGDERGGGGIDGGGVFGLILLFGVFFAVGGYFVGRPDRASAFVGTVKACLPANLPGRRAQTGASPNFSSSAGLSANDSCTPYVVPSVPGLTSSNA